MKLELEIENWPLREPFVTARDVMTEITTLTAVLTDGNTQGRGEALGVMYLAETAETMSSQIRAVQRNIEAGIDSGELQELLRPGGARNAIDCALWDLKAKRDGFRVSDIFAPEARPVTTVYTLSLAPAERMAADARQHADCPVLKVKLDPKQATQKIRAIRDARPDAAIVIDANGSWSLPLLGELEDVLVENRIDMVEQPLPMGQDGGLEGFEYAVTLCADESCQSSADLEYCAARYSMINIKLDKCGGLTEAMRMVNWCRTNGMELMVGNMLGTSLAMAPAMIPAQFCRFVDLDGPLFQVKDREHALTYRGAVIDLPDPRLWG
ncbi:MAG TPA: dipeptide epimerase [Woeseiaceae bacterium]|nr:dipeptide epimerase [Woeseiaceae bacterium]